MYYRTLGLQKTWLNKCLKSRVSGDSPIEDMANGLKQCCNLKDSSFTIFINHCEENLVGKSLF